MRSRPPKPAALSDLCGARTLVDRSRQRHPAGVSLMVGQTEPERRHPSSLFGGHGLIRRVRSLLV